MLFIGCTETSIHTPVNAELDQPVRSSKDKPSATETPSTMPNSTSDPDPDFAEVFGAWEKAGADIGWYGPNPKGFSDHDEKPNGEAVPAFWCYDCDAAVFRDVPTPSKPFAIHFGGSKSLTDDMLAKLARTKHLTALGLNNTNISDDGVKHLVHLKSLESLSLSDTSVTDAGLSALPELPSLNTLYVSSLDITDSGLDILATITTLEHLDMCHTKVTDAGLKKLTGLKQLKSLGVTGTAVTDVGLAELSKAFPKLEIDR